MEVVIQKWGNSSGIRIPSSILKSLEIKNNETLDLSLENGTIILKKAKKKAISFEKRVESFEKEFGKKGEIAPYDWGEDVGLEKW